MKIKKVGLGVYADINKKYAICKMYGGWNVFKCVNKTDEVLEYDCTYKYLADAKRYVENITE